MLASTFSALLFMAVATATITTTVAKQYLIGGLVGWRIPAPNETELYTTWASRRRFYIGDTLRFRYSSGSVVIVDKWGYYHCDSTHPISFFNDGNTTVTLDKAGTVYFITGDFEPCVKGERMMVNVDNQRHIPTPKAEPPHHYSIAPSSYSIAPSPFQMSGFGSTVLETGSSVLVSASFMASVFALAGLGLCLVQP